MDTALGVREQSVDSLNRHPTHCVHGQSTEFPSGARGSFEENPWDCHGQTAGHPWNVREASVER